MRPSSTFVILSSFLILMTVAPSNAATRGLRFGRMVDQNGQLVSDVVIVVDGDRIRSVGPASAAPPGIETIDLRRFTAIPGLIDVHTHITYYWDRTPGTRPRGQRRRPAVTVFLAQENARRTLDTGVTTVRDLNASAETDLAMRDLINLGAMVGPRLFVSGQGISSRQGAAPDPDAMRTLVEERIKSGVDWIKVFGSHGGFENVDTTQTVTFDEMRAIVDAAHALGHKVAIHSYGPGGGRDAVRAGADSLEHAVDLDDETIEEMVKRGTVYVPTIDHNRYYVEHAEEYGFAPGSREALEAYIARNLETARRAVKAGVRFAMGSDAVYTMFGENTRELLWFVKAGMTPRDALRAATVNGAALLGLEKSLGAIAPGYLADIVAVEGDPLADIDVVVSRVRWVMKGGEVVVDKTHGPSKPGNGSNKPGPN